MADENFKKVQDIYVTLYREDEEGETEVMVDQLETLWVPFDKDEDQFEISMDGSDQDAAQTNVRLYIPAKTMEFLFKEFLEYKALAEKEFHHKTKEESD